MDERAFWISPEGAILPVPLSHIASVIRAPEVFGLTREYLEDAYRKHKEPLGLEGKARGEIIAGLICKGWIRIREYREYLSVQVFDLDEHGSRGRLSLFFESAGSTYPADMEVRFSSFKKEEGKGYACYSGGQPHEELYYYQHKWTVRSFLKCMIPYCSPQNCRSNS
jgi:hypothetical protein